MDPTLISSEIQFLTLLTIAAGIAVVVKYIRLPYTIALVMGGLFVSLTGVQPYHLTEELILFIFLPPLLFEGAIHFELTDLRRNMKAIGTLAFPGLIASGFLAGYAILKVTGLPMTVALLVGVMITPTDPISVLALFKKLGVSRRLSMIVEGESVFNDGTGIVLYSVLLGIVTSGTLNIGASTLLFFKVVIGGLIVGLVLGYLAFLFLKRLDDHVLEVLITVLLAFGAFLVAEHTFHVSGVMAVVAAGVLVGNQGARLAMSPTTRLAIKNFWEIAAFVINSLIFLLIGTQIHLPELWAIWPTILAAFVIVTLARAAACYPSLLLLNMSGERIPVRWFHVINWGGIHGSIPVALALGLPDIPERGFIVNLVFGVVFLSLTIQGLTMSPLVHMLGLGGRLEEEEQYERTVARLVALSKALDELRQKLASGRVSRAIHDKVAGELEEDLRVARFRMEELETDPAVQLSWENRTRQASLTLQKSTLYEMMIQGNLSHESAEELMGEIDVALEKLEGEGN
ncbi:MAG: Na+/H+ antiporter [bacterium]|nr:Na+/H+ antiporter [bacterium]MDT8394839.1 Na+/H+ antiporter [bacterium]